MSRTLALFLLATCAEEPAPLMPPPCPAETTEVDGQCRGDLDPCGGACDASACIGGRCAPPGTPDLSGFWSGEMRIRVNCRGGHPGASIPLLWPAEQSGDVVVFSDALGTSTTTTSTAGFDLTIAREGEDVSFATMAPVHLSYFGKHISGPLLGTVALPGFGTCETAPRSAVRLERSGAPIAREVPPSFEGRWTGSLSIFGICLGTSGPGGTIIVIDQIDLAMTADLLHRSSGQIEGTIELVRGGFPFLAGQVTGRAEGDLLRLTEGVLDGNGVNLHLEPPPEVTSDEWGASGRLSFDGTTIDGEIAGWEEIDSPDVPYPCVTQQAFFRISSR